MNATDLYFRWKKGDKSFSLSESFKTHEFTCQCTHPKCSDQIIARELIAKLQRIRDQISIPIQITSGFRCSEHQVELGHEGYETAKGKSQHELGRAADIFTENLLKMPTILQKEFCSIGYSRHFIHIDLRGPLKRYWTYRE